MTFEEFMYYLDAYGASFERWPRELRGPAKAFLVASPAAVAARAETARLDALLDRNKLAPDAAREMRVKARARSLATSPSRRTLARFTLSAGAASLWPRAAVLAFVAVLGVVTGTLTFESPQADSATIDVSQLHADDSPFEVAGL